VVNVLAAHARVREEILRLVHRGLPVPEFARAVGDAVARAVPAEGTCLMTTDPATMLPTAEFVENGLPAAELLRLVEIDRRPCLGPVQLGNLARCPSVGGFRPSVTAISRRRVHA
jgi:hypothetical protein